MSASLGAGISQRVEPRFFHEFTEQKTDDGRVDHVPAWRDQLLANSTKTWRPTEMLIANATVVRHLAEHRLSRSK